MKMNRIQRGMVMVLILLLSGICVPVMADAGLTTWQSRRIESGIAFEQYQWALEEMERNIQNAIPNDPVKKGLLIRIPPGPDSLELYKQYQWALRQMENDLQMSTTSRELGGKPRSIQIWPGDADSFQQYQNALEHMERSIQNAVPNE